MKNNKNSTVRFMVQSRVNGKSARIAKSEWKLPEFMHNFTIRKNKNSIVVTNLRERIKGRKTKWFEPSLFYLNIKSGLSSLKKYKKIDYGGKIIHLSSGKYLQVWGERHDPRDIDVRPWKILKFRLLNSDFTPIVGPQNVTVSRIKADTFLNFSFYEEKNRIFLFWNMEFNKKGEVDESVKYKIINPKTGKSLSGVKLLSSLIGHHPKTPPVFIRNIKSDKKLMIWKNNYFLLGAVITTLKQVTPIKISAGSPMSYFPDDVRGILFNDSSFAVCWMTWGRKVEKLFKKNLWCKRISASGHETGKKIKINASGSVPKNHHQVNNRNMELLINDYEITPLNQKDVFIVWSIKDLSERYFYPLGIYSKILSTSKLYKKPKMLVSFAKNEKNKNCDTQIQAISVVNGKTHILYSKITPLTPPLLLYK